MVEKDAVVNCLQDVLFRLTTFLTESREIFDCIRSTEWFCITNAFDQIKCLSFRFRRSIVCIVSATKIITNLFEDHILMILPESVVILRNIRKIGSLNYLPLSIIGTGSASYSFALSEIRKPKIRGVYSNPPLALIKSISDGFISSNSKDQELVILYQAFNLFVNGHHKIGINFIIKIDESLFGFVIKTIHKT